jgi:hypothetical protein
MVPKGVLAYVAGLVVLFAGMSMTVLVLLYAFALPARHHAEGPICLALGGLLIFAALHMIAAGLYRMLVHVYHTISRTDPAGDRPLRGRTVFLLGQLGCAMALPTTVLFLILSAAAPPVPPGGVPRGELEKGIWGILPAGFFMTLTMLIFFAGLGIMVRDIFVRHRDIVEGREAERRRRLDQEANEPRTEVIPVVRTVDELREHVKRDR